MKLKLIIFCLALSFFDAMVYAGTTSPSFIKSAGRCYLFYKFDPTIYAADLQMAADSAAQAVCLQQGAKAAQRVSEYSDVYDENSNNACLQSVPIDRLSWTNQTAAYICTAE